MIEIVSLRYTKENCKCYERKLGESEPITSIKIVPDSNYILRRTYEENGEMKIDYNKGFAVLAIGQIATNFSEIEAVEENQEEQNA